MSAAWKEIRKKVRKEFQFKNIRFELDNEESKRNFYELKWMKALTCSLLYRAFMLLYTLAWLVADVILYKKNFFLAYLTHWGEVIMVLYFLIAFLVLVVSTRSANHDDSSLQWYHVIMWIIFEIYITSAFVISIAYHIGVAFELSGQVNDPNPLNIHDHVINSVLAIIELTLSDLPVRILHFYWPMLLGMVYGLFTFSLHVTDVKSDIYDVIDWENNAVGAIGGVFATLGFCLFVHVFIVWGIFLLLTLCQNNCLLKIRESEINDAHLRETIDSHPRETIDSYPRETIGSYPRETIDSHLNYYFDE